MTEIATARELVIPVTTDYLVEDGIYKISCPELQGCSAWAEHLDDALRAMAGNIRAMLAARREKGSPVPPQFEAIDEDTVIVLRIAGQQ